jgi:autotransporter-associated beta strand protein
VTFATALTSSGGSLTKSGGGSLTVSAPNSYSGGTSVSDGALIVTGSISGGVAVSKLSGTLANAPVLAGHGDLSTTGVVGGAVTLGGVGAVGVLNAGTNANDKGSMRLGSVAVASGSQIQFNISQRTTTLDSSDLNTLTNALANNTFTDVRSLLGTGLQDYDNIVPAANSHDYLQVAGSLTVDASSATPSFKIVDSTDSPYSANNPQIGDVFNLMDWGSLIITSGPDFNPNDFDLPSLGADLRFDLSAFKDYGIAVVVPEPSRVMLLLLGLVVLALRRRRR